MGRLWWDCSITRSHQEHLPFTCVTYKNCWFVCFVLFDLILNIPSTIFQLNRDGSSWVEPVRSWDKCVLLKDHNTVTPVRLEPAAPRFWVKHSTTKTLRYHRNCWILRFRFSIIKGHSLSPDRRLVKYLPNMALLRAQHFCVKSNADLEILNSAKLTRIQEKEQKVIVLAWNFRPSLAQPAISISVCRNS